MKSASIILALAGSAIAAPAASCVALPASFDVTNFKFSGQRGPIFTEQYNFNIAANIGDKTAATCHAASAQSNSCGLAIEPISQTTCTDNSAYSFSFTPSEPGHGYSLQVNYSVPACGVTLTACRFFPETDIQCVADPSVPSVHYEKLDSASSFSMPVSSNGKCPQI